jgi:hypothetical protein
MAQARPHGIALVLLVLFALALSGAALLFLGYAALLIVATIVLPDDSSEDIPATLVVVVSGISAFLGSAFAMVAAALWRAIIGPRGHSHA